jgi:hypothetical protein
VESVRFPGYYVDAIVNSQDDDRAHAQLRLTNANKPNANTSNANKPNADKPNADKPNANKPNADKSNADKSNAEGDVEKKKSKRAHFELKPIAGRGNTYAIESKGLGGYYLDMDGGKIRLTSQDPTADPEATWGHFTLKATHT